MTISYIILAYNHPLQLKRLVERLQTDETFFYIHIDRKSDINQFISVLPETGNISYIPKEERVDCHWGDLSLVEAVLVSCRKVLQYGHGGYVVLLSGQDYPIRGNQYINDFLNDNKGLDFLSIYPVPDKKKSSENGGEERFENYTFDCQNSKNSRMKAKIRPLSFNVKTLGGFVRLAIYRRDLLPLAVKDWFVPRHYPNCLAKVFNEMWFVLQFDTVEYIVRFWESHPEIKEYYTYTHIPDETAFGSILCADAKHRERLRDMCHLIDWDVNLNGSPKTFHEKDFSWIEQQKRVHPNLLFARKFNQDDDILDLLDKRNGYEAR